MSSARGAPPGEACIQVVDADADLDQQVAPASFEREHAGEHVVGHDPAPLQPQGRAERLLERLLAARREADLRRARRMPGVLAEQLESLHVRNARAIGWSWQDVADELGVSKQAVHRKHAGRS